MSKEELSKLKHIRIISSSNSGGATTSKEYSKYSSPMNQPSSYKKMLTAKRKSHEQTLSSTKKLATIDHNLSTKKSRDSKRKVPTVQ